MSEIIVGCWESNDCHTVNKMYDA